MSLGDVAALFFFFLNTSRVVTLLHSHLDKLSLLYF